MKNLLLLSLVLFTLVACHQQMNEMDMQSMPTAENSLDQAKQVGNTAENTQAKIQNNSQSNMAARKVIKTANLKCQVTNLEQVTHQVDSLAFYYGGYVASMNQDNNNYSRQNQITIKLPAENFSDFLVEIDQRSVFQDHKRINAQDVSEEFVDISARLKTKKAVRDRYTEVLRSKATNVEEILNAENQIRVIQEEIESIEQRIIYLGNQSAMSTINLEIYQEVEFVQTPEVYKKTYFNKVGESFAIGGKIIEKISLTIIALWPLLLIGIPLFVFRKSIFRRKIKSITN